MSPSINFYDSDWASSEDFREPDLEEKRAERRAALIFDAMAGRGAFWPENGSSCAEYDNGQEFPMLHAVRDACALGLAATPEQRWKLVERCILREAERYADSVVDDL